MAARVLLVTFQQALRSLVLSLLPITTITLIAWALAGSQSGNTADPLRASIWIWLGSHLIPFQLKLAPAYLSTFFNYLPLAATLLPIIALRSSFKRASEELRNPRAARSFITIWYSLLVTFAALLMQTRTVSPVIYLAPIYAALFALLSTIDFSSNYFKDFKFLGYLLLTFTGFATLLIFFSLLVHFPLVKSLSIVISPGWAGGFLFLLLQLIYLPNLMVATISYICGFGFSIGAGTLVTPLSVKLNGIPAIPILAALPSKNFPWVITFTILLGFFLFLNQIRIVKKSMDLIDTFRKLSQNLSPFLIAALFLSYQSGGTLVTKSLNPFGVSWWSLPAILILSQLVILTLFLLVPFGIKKIISR